MEKRYWIKAVYKNGQSKIFNSFYKKLEEALDYCHTILNDNEEVEYCIPVLVKIEDLNVEVRRQKKQ